MQSTKKLIITKDESGCVKLIYTKQDWDWYGLGGESFDGVPPVETKVLLSFNIKMIFHRHKLKETIYSDNDFSSEIVEACEVCGKTKYHWAHGNELVKNWKKMKGEPK